MAVMDASHGPAPHRIAATVEVLLNSMRRTGGVLVLNMHPHYQASVEAPGVAQQYVKALEYILKSRDQGWVCTLHLSKIREILDARTQSIS